MNKLDLPPHQAYPTNVKAVIAPVSSVPLGSISEASGHLLVLIPADMEYSGATQRMGELARTTGMSVRLLGLCKDKAEEPGLRRALINMASLLQDQNIGTEVKIDIGSSWINPIQAIYTAGDVIVCFEEPRTGLLRKPLSQVLGSSLHATVYVLSNPAPQTNKPNRLASLSTWLGVLGIIAGFGMLQAKIVQLPVGWLQNILLLLSILPEFWLVWAWDSQFR